MSVICSSHNLIELEDLNNRLSETCYVLRLLWGVPFDEREGDFHSVLDEYICRVSDLKFDFRIFEDCLRNGIDMNAKFPSTEHFAEGSHSLAELPTTE